MRKTPEQRAEKVMAAQAEAMENTRDKFDLKTAIIEQINAAETDVYGLCGSLIRVGKIAFREDDLVRVNFDIWGGSSAIVRYGKKLEVLTFDTQETDYLAYRLGIES